MFIDPRPILRNREYRLLFIGQTVSYLGSMISYVALPWQVYELTKSSFMVGLISAVELLPILLFSLLGGSLADSLNRRKLVLYAEVFMSLCALLLAVNASLDEPYLSVIFIAAALMQSANGFHRPAMDALVQKLVPKEDFATVSAIGSMRASLGAIVGPSLGGIIIAVAGVKAAYLFDFATFLIAVWALYLMKPTPAPEKQTTVRHQDKIREGLKYAFSRPELVGTYIVDITAMTFAFPLALFPAMGEQWGGAKAAGLLFSSMAVGSLIVTLFSGWTRKVRRHGRCVVIAASLWGLSIVALGFAPNLMVALVCLAFAGAADTISAIFRQVIWNETIPNELRGRLASIEMISYMSGPLLGNARSGWVASAAGLRMSIVSGGVLCFAGVVACGFLLPKFWRYRSEKPEQAQSAA